MGDFGPFGSDENLPNFGATEDPEDDSSSIDLEELEEGPKKKRNIASKRSRSKRRKRDKKLRLSRKSNVSEQLSRISSVNSDLDRSFNAVGGKAERRGRLQSTVTRISVAISEVDDRLDEEDGENLEGSHRLLRGGDSSMNLAGNNEITGRAVLNVTDEELGDMLKEYEDVDDMGNRVDITIIKNTALDKKQKKKTKKKKKKKKKKTSLAVDVCIGCCFVLLVVLIVLMVIFIDLIRETVNI